MKHQKDKKNRKNTPYDHNNEILNKSIMLKINQFKWEEALLSAGNDSEFAMTHIREDVVQDVNEIFHNRVYKMSPKRYMIKWNNIRKSTDHQKFPEDHLFAIFKSCVDDMHNVNDQRNDRNNSFKKMQM